MGQIVEPQLSISDDGSQSLEFSIPYYYVDKASNQRIENPRWKDAESGILAENTRVLKVYVEYPGETKVFPFIVDKIIDARDSNFKVMKKVSCSGLAFAELGKIGYKIEFSDQALKDDWETDENVIPTVNYWLDKVFPNERDTWGRVTKWLTPWSYRIAMDWSDYPERAADKVYEDIYTTSWGLSNGTLVPESISELEEKARLLEVQNSNKYNITQDIAETFGIFCVYEYKVDNAGRFVREYKDGDNVLTGRCVVFYNKAIKGDNPLHLTYQHNLQTFSRTSDTSELYTKLYVSPISSSQMESGYISIADAEGNPLQDDFILNFDYLYSVGSITDLQKSQIEDYKVKLRDYNAKIAALEETIANETILLNDVSADATAAKEAVSAAHEQYLSYQVLAENEIYTTPLHKDVNNRYNGVFVPSAAEGIVKCDLHLDGVLAEGYDIRAYKDVKYSQTETIFTYADLVLVSGVKTPEDDTTFYGILDEYGFLSEIYTSINNTKLGEKVSTGAVVYFDLWYNPRNKYEKVMEKFQTLEQVNASKQSAAEAKQKTLQEALDKNTKERDSLLAAKDKLNHAFERQLNGALREGYWTPDSYGDVGSLVKLNATNGTSPFLWDTEAFEEETLPYYYANAEDQVEDKKTFYPYVDLSGVSTEINDTFALYLTKPLQPYTTDEYFAGGPAMVMFDASAYYFDLTGYSGADNTIEVSVDYAADPKVVVKINGTSLTVYNSADAFDAVVENGSKNANNLTSRFGGVAGSLVSMTLYPNAGFTFGFVRAAAGDIKLIALLDNDAIDYDRYKLGSVYYTKSITEKAAIAAGIQEWDTTNTYVYPRIFLDYRNVNYQSDEFLVYKGEDALTRYEDYSILLRDWKPYLTFKISQNCSVSDILNKTFHLTFRVSRANEQLYQDAKQVALDNSQPKYSYELTKANIPDEMEAVALGQLTYINDYSLGVFKTTGYISGITLSLDDPSQDELTIQNYKTRFEDLFSSITASSEAMRVNKRSYDTAANGFTAGGTLAPAIFERALAQTNVGFNFSRTKVAMDNTGGITLTNETPYSNGVYGQVALRGGGIYCSNAVDELGNRIWNSAITPNGINASLITAGQLDTNMIRIYNGNNLAFQWNSEGLYAYATDDLDRPDLSTYVRYSQDGLQYVKGNFTAVDLGWNGLNIAAQDGAVTLNGSDGLTIYNAENNKVAHLGKVEQDGSVLYGLRLYDGTDEQNLTFYNTNEGNLWLKSELLVGGETQGTGSGISGKDTAANDLRFWTGASDNRDEAPFRVYEDGSFYATKGRIGNLTIEGLEDAVNAYTVRVISSLGETYVDGITSTTTLTAELYSGSSRITVPTGYSVSYQWYENGTGNNWVAIAGATKSTFSIEMTNKKSYRCAVELTKGGA